MKLSSPYLFLIRAGKKLCASVKQIFNLFRVRIYSNTSRVYPIFHKVHPKGLRVLRTVNMVLSTGLKNYFITKTVHPATNMMYNIGNMVLNIGYTMYHIGKRVLNISSTGYHITNPVHLSVLTVHSRAPTVLFSLFRN